VRVNNVYTHIAVRDKLQLDDGERDGKLDFNFHVEMNAILTMPIPHYFAYYAAEDITMGVMVQEPHDGCIAIYSINTFDIPKYDEHHWPQGAITDYLTDEGDTEIDLNPILNGENPLTKAIHHDYTSGVSPSHFINIKLIRDDDVAKNVEFHMDWENNKIILDKPEPERMLHIVIYYDREYIATLETEEKHLYNSKNRIEKS
jgi:hypothetical protein